MTEQTKEPVMSEEETNETDGIEIIDAPVEGNEENEQEASEVSTDDELETLKQEKAAIQERYLRLHAEFDNFKKRTQREKVAERKYKSQDLALELLPALDNFERALQVEAAEDTQSIVDGITMVYKQIKSAFASQDVQVIDAQPGTPFNPEVHDGVILEENANFESNQVIEELQKGYILHDRVIRPAMVKVSK